MHLSDAADGEVHTLLKSTACMFDRPSGPPCISSRSTAQRRELRSVRAACGTPAVRRYCLRSSPNAAELDAMCHIGSSDSALRIPVLVGQDTTTLANQPEHSAAPLGRPATAWIPKTIRSVSDACDQPSYHFSALQPGDAFRNVLEGDLGQTRRDLAGSEISAHAFDVAGVPWRLGV
jgi:hypothetical protein